MTIQITAELLTELLPCPFCGGEAEFDVIPVGVMPQCTCCGVELRNGSVGIGWYESRELAAADWNRRAALAHQPATVAVPEGWKLVPVELTPEMYSAFGYVKEVPFVIWRKVLAAAPAAPVAAGQEPVAWRVSDPDEPEIGHWLSEEPGTSWQRSEPLYTAPPAAEQPKCETCNGHGVVGGLRPDGYDSETCPQCAGTGYDCPDCIMLAEQPDTVKVPRELATALLDEGKRSDTWAAQDKLRALLAGGDKA